MSFELCVMEIVLIKIEVLEMIKGMKISRKKQHRPHGEIFCVLWKLYEKCVGNYADGQKYLSSDKVGPRYAAVFMQPIR